MDIPASSLYNIEKKSQSILGCNCYLDMLSDIELLNDVFDEGECQHEVAWVLLSVQALNEAKDKVR